MQTEAPTLEEFTAQVDTLITTLGVIRAGASMANFPNTDYSIPACEAAAKIGGFDLTFAKLFNREFRRNAVCWQ